MKEITVIGYCDGDHEEKTLSTVERTVSISGSKPVTLDLCDRCDVPIQRLLVLMERGVVVKPKRKGPKPPSPGTLPPLPGTLPPLEGPHVCPACGFESKSRSALGQHLAQRHGKRFRDYAVA